MQYFFDSWSTKHLIVLPALFLFWWRKLVPKKFYEKMENNSTLEQVLPVFNKNAELLRLVGATFVTKMVFLRRMRKKNLILLKSWQHFKYKWVNNIEIYNFTWLPVLYYIQTNIFIKSIFVYMYNILSVQTY